MVEVDGEGGTISIACIVGKNKLSSTMIFVLQDGISIQTCHFTCCEAVREADDPGL